MNVTQTGTHLGLFNEGLFNKGLFAQKAYSGGLFIGFGGQTVIGFLTVPPHKYRSVSYSTTLTPHFISWFWMVCLRWAVRMIEIL